MAQNWNEHVNTAFYGADFTYLENYVQTQFKSGRTVSNLLNSVPHKAITLLLECNDEKDINGKTEAGWLLWWYENVILSGTETFYLKDLVAGAGTREYRLEGVLTWNGQKDKEFTLAVVEV